MLLLKESSPTPHSLNMYMASSGVALWALVMALNPDVGFIAPAHWMAVFWALQIGTGLLVLQGLLFLITRSSQLSRLPLWSLVLLSGFLGSVILSPLYWLIGEGLMQEFLGFQPSVDDVTDLTSGHWLQAIGDEFLEIVGPVTASWILISWPRLNGLVPPLLYQNSPTQRVEALQSDHGLTSHVPSTPDWRKALPHELGTNVIAVSSELQYLRVWTPRGNALILGSLQEVERTEGPAGLRVHRSWWVHAHHVIRLREQGSLTVCELSNGMQAPVSRRRKADALTRFGNGACYENPDNNSA